MAVRQVFFIEMDANLAPMSDQEAEQLDRDLAIALAHGETFFHPPPGVRIRPALIELPDGAHAQAAPERKIGPLRAAPRSPSTSSTPG